MTKLKLYDGHEMPIIGLGTWNTSKNEVGKAVKYAIEEVGYRHIDCAAIYENEKEIGEAFKEIFSGKVKREEVFVTSKLWNTNHKAENVEQACKQTLKDLQLDYLDLYLVHWDLPQQHGDDLEPMGEDNKTILERSPMHETWAAMENLVRKGLVKSIGVANFNTTILIDLMTYANIKPAVNQIELHPYLNQRNLIDYCKYLGIVVTAYSPLGSPGATPEGYIPVIQDEEIKEIAKKYVKTPAQIMLRWGIQRETIVIQKSSKPERIKGNFDVFNFELSEEDFEKLNSLNKNIRYCDPKLWYGIPYFE